MIISRIVFLIKKGWYQTKRLLAMKSLWYVWDVITKRKIASRQGTCSQCGLCCINPKTGKSCEYLGKAKFGIRKCKIYGERNKKAFWCSLNWPYCQRDLSESKLEGKCSYFWWEGDKE